MVWLKGLGKFIEGHNELGLEPGSELPLCREEEGAARGSVSGPPRPSMLCACAVAYASARASEPGLPAREFVPCLLRNTVSSHNSQ